jgi:hypothetical protein
LFDVEIELNDAIEARTNVFEGLFLRFITDGKIIEGHLTGSERIWEFTSSDRYFREHYPQGVIRNSMLYLDGPLPEQQNIYDELSISIDRLIN